MSVAQYFLISCSTSAIKVALIQRHFCWVLVHVTELLTQHAHLGRSHLPIGQATVLKCLVMPRMHDIGLGKLLYTSVVLGSRMFFIA